MAGCDILNDRSDFRYAVVKTIPVFFSYLFVGVAYGMTLKEAGYGWPWALLASSAVYAGSLQFALTAFMASGADLLTVALTTLFVNSRHIFYGLSYTRSLRKTGRWYPYLIFALTDETYSLYCASVSDPRLTPAAMRHMAWLDHLYWIAGSVLGALVGELPISFEGIDFAMTALFITIALDQLRSPQARKSALVGLITGAVLLVILGPDRFMLPALSLSALLLALQSGRREAA